MFLQPEHFEQAATNGISESLLYQRVYMLGKDIEEAMTEPVNTKCHKKGLWEQWKDKAVVCYGTFSSRVRAGKSPEEAAMTPAMRKDVRAKLGAEKSIRSRQANAKIKESEYRKALANGVSRETLRNRVFHLGWSMERATTTPPRQTSRSRAAGRYLA